MALINRFVDPTVVGGAGDGTSWADAWTTYTQVLVEDPGGAGDEVCLFCRGGVDNATRFQLNSGISADALRISIEDENYYVDFNDPFDEGFDISSAATVIVEGAYPFRIVNNTTSQARNTVNFVSGAQVTISTGLIVHNPATLPNATTAVFIRGGTTNVTINNLLIYQETNVRGLRFADAGMVANINNATIIGSGANTSQGVEEFNGVGNVNSCYAGGDWSNCIDGGTTQDAACATEDSSSDNSAFDNIAFDTTNFESVTWPGIANILGSDFARPTIASGLLDAALTALTNDIYGNPRAGNNSIGAVVPMGADTGIIDAELTLAASAELLQSPQTTFEAALNAALSMGIDTAANASYAAVYAEAIRMDMAPTPTRLIDCLLTLATEAAFAPSSVAVIEASLTLTSNAAFTSVSNSSIDAAVNLGINADLGGQLYLT